MRILVIEDEALAADRLIKLIKEIEPGAEIVGKLESVREALTWCRPMNLPDLYLWMYS
jgi:DNA-binding LytR/AlgR family response regulator